MFPFKKLPVQETELDKTINMHLEMLREIGCDDPEYKTIQKTVKLLTDLRAQNPAREKMSPNALIPAAVTLISVIVIVGYEQKHVLNSKALGFLPKLLK